MQGTHRPLRSAGAAKPSLDLNGQALNKVVSAGYQHWLDTRGRLMLKNLTYAQLEQWCQVTGLLPRFVVSRQQ